jgi:hypothetical protein
MAAAMTDLHTAWSGRGQGDACIRTWVEALSAWRLTWPTGAAVLEIGAHEAGWLNAACEADPSIQATGLDWRGSQPGPGTRLKGDVLVADFPPEAFDAIVMISTLEHIGIGNYNSDPLAEDGDVQTLRRCAGWLKPGGFVYADVPYSATYRVFGKKCRIYDQAAVETRLAVPTLRLAWQLWTDLNGQPISRERAVMRRDGGRPFTYTALLWRKDTPNGT